MTELPILNEQQAAELQRLRSEVQGVTLLDKIDEAGHALAAMVAQLLGGSVVDKIIVVLAGVGNNGAAGMAAVRHLHEAGATVQLVLAAKAVALHEMAAHQLAILREMGIEPWGLSLSAAAMDEMEPIHWTSADLIVDAIFGSGLRGDPREDAADLIGLANASRRPILALDLPSGLHGDEGTIYSPCIDATATLALALPRQAMLEGWPVVGELWVATLDIAPALYERLGLPAPVPSDSPLRHLGPARKVKREQGRL